MGNGELLGVVLAAGKGSRMAQLPTRLPKPVLPILDQPIVHHQLRIMAELGIRRVLFVVGQSGYEIVRQVERAPDTGLEIEYVDQEEALGIAHSVGRLEQSIDRPFMLFLGDIYFHAPRINEMLDTFHRPGVDAVLAAIREEDPGMITKNFCITAECGRATQVVEKPRFPSSDLKGVGVYLFQPVVFDAIRRTPRTAMRNEYELTESIEIMIRDGRDVRVSLSIEDDLNVTHPADLLAANLRVLEYEGLERYVASTAQVAKDATLDRAVVGGSASIGEGAVVRNCVVFGGAGVAAGERLEDAVVTESGVFKV